MPPSILRRVAALKALQDESELHDVEYKKERIQLEMKYRVLKEPLLEARSKIVSGEVEVPKSSTDESPGTIVDFRHLINTTAWHRKFAAILINHCFPPQKRRPSQKTLLRGSPATGPNAS